MLIDVWWTVPANVRGGAWVGVVRCSRPKAKTVRRTAQFAVTASSENVAPIVAPGSLSRRSTRRVPGAGKGSGGGYPHNDATCESTGKRNGRCAGYNWGYRTGGAFKLNSARGFGYRNCTDFVAWKHGLTWSEFKFGRDGGNAANWKAKAANAGLVVVTTPAVGDIAWWGGTKKNPAGHVAIVSAVNANGTVTIEEYNGDYLGNHGFRPNMRADAYLRKPAPQPVKTQPKPSDHLGHIVQWDGDTKSQKTAWLVGLDGKRRWIPTIEIFWCLKEQGHPGPDVLPASMLDRLPDQIGVHATCDSGATGGTGGGGNPGTGGGNPGTGAQPPPAQRVNAYDNYGSGAVGRAMCRGNPSVGASMPGGTASQSFTVPSGVASIDTALVQIDPDSRVTATATLAVNGQNRATAAAAAAGDTRLNFPSVAVAPGNTMTLSIRFSATFGKIITVYTAGRPGGVFTASNSCPDGAPSFSTTTTGLRAVITGWNRS